MAKWPTGGNVYPVTPKAYPASPKAYPGTGIAAYPGAAAPTDPLVTLGANCLQWCRGDLGVTIGTGVSDWADQSGNGFHYAQVTGAAQPTFGATDGPNSTPALTFDGVDDVLSAAGLNLPAPGTTPTWIWIVLKQIAWTNGRRIVAPVSLTTRVALSQSTLSPSLEQFNGVSANLNNGATLGSWVAVQSYYSNTVNDFIGVNDVALVTGTSAGNNSGATGRTLGGAAASLFSNTAVAEIVYANVLPSPGQLASFAAYRLARYGF